MLDNVLKIFKEYVPLFIFLQVFSVFTLGVAQAKEDSQVDSSLLITQSCEGELFIKLETKRLIALSISEDHLEEVKSLYADKDVMAKFGDGKPRSPERTEVLVRLWISRWQQGDPRGGFVVYSKEEEKLIGVIISGKGDLSDESEVAYLLHVSSQGKGFGTEIITALVRDYVPWMKKNSNEIFNGDSLKYLVATSSPDNPASWKILDKLGFVAYDSSLDVLVDLREDDITLENSSGDLPDYEKFNMYDVKGVLRTAEKRSRYGIMKWHFKLLL